jgi:hypothetical protein
LVGKKERDLFSFKTQEIIVAAIENLQLVHPNSNDGGRIEEIHAHFITRVNIINPHLR